MPPRTSSHRRRRRSADGGPRTSPRKAVGYIRVSEEGGRAGPELHTIDIQRDAIERVCRERGYELVATFEDINRSGKDRARPGFKRAMDMVMAGEVDAMAVWKVSRFSRSWYQAAKDTERLLNRSPEPADLLSTEGFDTTTIGGQLMMRILFIIADWEHSVLTEQWENSKDRAFERGAHNAPTPVGYLRVRARPTKPDHISIADALPILAALDFERDPEDMVGMLVPDEDAKPHIIEAYRMRLRGESWAEIRRYLKKHVKPKRSREWSTTVVKRLLTLRVYIGEVTQHVWDPVVDDETGEIVDRRLVERRVQEDAHPALVPIGLFEDVQPAVETNETGTRKRAEAGEFPLTGRLYCRACSYKMFGNNRKRTIKVFADTGKPVGRGRRTDRLARDIVEAVEHFRVYTCARVHGGGVCPEPSTIDADHAEAVVRDLIPHGVIAIKVERRPHDASLDEVDRRLAMIDRNIQQTRSLEAQEELGDEWFPTLRQLRAQKDAILLEREEAASALRDQGLAANLEDVDPFLAAVHHGAYAIMVRRLRRGSSPADRVHVVWNGDETLPLGGPTNRIEPTRFVFPDERDRHADSDAA